VKELAVELGVPQSIIDIPPTAGLWDGQTDEQELGMTYDEVAWAIDFDNHCYKDVSREGDVIYRHGLRALTGQETVRQKSVLTTVRTMRQKNAHKLHYPPVFDPEKSW
jgi:NAD+ synthetase